MKETKLLDGTAMPRFLLTSSGRARDPDTCPPELSFEGKTRPCRFQIPLSAPMERPSRQGHGALVKAERRMETDLCRVRHDTVRREHKRLEHGPEWEGGPETTSGGCLELRSPHSP